MKPEQFIRENGVEKAREVVDGAPEGATHYELNVDGDFYFKYQGFEWFCLADGLMVRTYMEDHETFHLIPLSDLKRLVESVEIIQFWHGIEWCKGLVEDYKEESIHKESYGHRIIQAIADYESIYGGGDE